MTFIDLGDEFAKTKEPEVAPEGREFDLAVTAVEEQKDESKKKHNIRLVINIEHGKGEGPYQNIFHYIAVPNKKWDVEKDEDKGRKKGSTTEMKMLMLKRVLALFGLPWEDVTGFAPNDFLGARARCSLKQEEYEGRLSNKIEIPRLPSSSS